MATIEVVSRVHIRTGLLVCREPWIEAPIAGARHIDEPGAVDVDAGDCGESALRFDQNGEPRISEFANVENGAGDRKRCGQEPGVVPVSHVSIVPDAAVRCVPSTLTRAVPDEVA